MSGSSVNDLASLSNEDVKLLYDIVSAAEQSSAPPYRALFTAYEQTLAEHGIPKDNDQLYLRFLLRMGEGRTEGSTLFDQFELLLSKLGIQVAFDGEDAQNEDAGSRASGSSPRIERLQTRAFRPARRGSFDSAINSNANTQHSSSQLQLLPTRPRSLDGASEYKRRSIPESEVHVNSLRSALRNSPKSHALSGGAGVTEQGTDSAADSHRSPQPYKGTASSSAGRPRSSAKGTQGDADDESSELDETSHTLQDALQPPLPPQKAKPTEAELDGHASSLRFHHLAVTAVRLFRHWRSVAEQSHNQHSAMDQSAHVYDARILLRQAFEQWRAALEEERQIRATEKFYETLEERTTKARNDFLLSKAFTHWAQCMREEVARKGAAQTRVLKAKYFNAWRDISLVNAFKVRRQVLSKFMSVWKQRTSNAILQEERAAGYLTSRTAQQTYRAWFWHFCERRAPAWYATKLQRALLSRWREAARAGRTRRQWATDFRNLELQRKCLVLWTQSSNVVQNSIFQAVNFRHQRLLGPTVDALRRELRLAPLEDTCMRLVDTRVLRSALTIWNYQARAILQAREVNALRIQRNAWTAWNDALRCRALQQSVNERIAVQTLYKWVLAERLALAKRVSEEKLLSSVFACWHEKINDLGAALGRARHLARSSKERKVKSSILAKWSSHAALDRQEAERAQRYRDVRLASSAMGTWISSNTHLVKISRWADDARFYMLATKTMKQWRDILHQSRKNKRKEAYATTRRNLKMRLARDVLHTWQGRTKRQTDLTSQADAAHRARLYATLLELVNYWHFRVQSVREASLQAEAMYDRHVLQTHLRVILIRHQDIRTAHVNADGFLAESKASSATTCFRRLNWQLFQVRRLHESARSLEQRNERKHFKGMLRHWADATKSRRLADAGPVTFDDVDATVRRPARTTIARAEQWTPFPGAALPASPAATPAYLRTPVRHQRPRSAKPALPSKTIEALPFEAALEDRPDVSQTMPTGHRTVQLARPQLIAVPTTPLPPVHSYPRTQPQPRAQITPFMSRLRTQYAGQPPASTGLFTRSTRFTRGNSRLSRNFASAEENHEDDDVVNETTAELDTTQFGRSGMFDVVSEADEENGDDE